MHGASGPSSSRHWNDDGSSAENTKVADRLFASPAGPETTVALGERVSTVHVCKASGPVLFGPTVRTANLCVPSARPLYAAGETHCEKSAPSIRHSKPVCAIAEKVKLALVEFVALGGAAMIWAGGPTRLIVQVHTAGLPVLPA